MSVSYQELRQLRPASLNRASTALSTAATKLAAEHTQYKTRVVDSLKARRGWHGGGQPDAAAVAEVNGLAIDTTRLRAAAGAAAYTYAFAGLTLAQMYLTALEKKVENGGMRITEFGSVVDAHDPNSSRRTRCQVQLQKILDFASAVDSHASHTLDANHEPPVTGLTNKPGLLQQARSDNAAAADDARKAVGLLRSLGDDARDLPNLKDDLFQGLSLPAYSVQVPPGAPTSAAVGAFFIALGINMGVGGAELVLESGGALSPEAAVGIAGGAGVAEIGILLVRNAGVGLSQLQISQASDGSAPSDGSPQKLNDLLQQAKKLEQEAKPNYGEDLIQKPNSDEYIEAHKAAQKIADGHAYPKHVADRGEFRGIHSKRELAEVIEQTIEKGEVKRLAEDRTAFWYKGVFVSVDESTADGGTIFIPHAGRAYFDELDQYTGP
ncbi:MAG: hypothetical protein J2P24_04055 [Streptosporangiales bacterium]|nr:hypothetical protein [Streptosporangiales bacterium]MBO0889953.1 hypothetical protein [Acidothermales bacterium]